MTRTHDVVEELVDTLRNNIDDPISQRADDGKNWIFHDMPRLDSTLPRVGMDVVSVTHTPLAVGTAKQVKTARIQVSILVDTTENKFDLDDSGDLNVEEDVLDYIADQIEDTIIQEQDRLRDDLNIRHILPTSSTQFRVDDSNVVQRNIDLEAAFV